MMIHGQELQDKERGAGKGDRCGCFDHPCDATESTPGQVWTAVQEGEKDEVEW